MLLSPTPQGLQKLLDVCARYADAHDIAFNVKKTVCMAILPSLFKSMSLPDIVLNGTVLSYVNKYKYLGYEVSNAPTKSDDLEVQQQYRLLCCRANSLIKKFSFCTYQVKKYLYSMYCWNVSGVHQWHSHRVSVLRKFIVCFNNAARMSFGFARFSCASSMYVNERNDNFWAMYRKAVFGFMTRIGQFCNSIIASLFRLFHGDLRFLSSIRQTWSTALFA